MIKQIIQLLSRISGTLNLDLLWRICSNLLPRDRMTLALRLIRSRVELLTIRMEGALITAFSWDESITIPLVTNGHYQGNEIKAVLSWMRHHSYINQKKNVIIDVGANIGTTSISFVQQTDCQVLAIEPFPDNFELLLKNVSQNNLKNRITCVQKAVFSNSEVVQMILPKRESGGAKVQQSDTNNLSADNSNIQRIANISADGLSSIIESCQFSPEQIAFVWSDTEGSEMHVVKTGESLWKTGIPLYVEIYPLALRRLCDINGFVKLLDKFFDCFIRCEELVAQGSKAPSVHIAEMWDLIKILTKTDIKTDVLLIPRNHKHKFEKK